MKKVNICVGRFQPITNGHLKMAEEGYKKNGLKCVMLMISNKKFDVKHPFTDNLIQKELDIIRVSNKYIEDSFYIDSADLVKFGDILFKNEYEAQLWVTGSDRVKAYTRMAENPKYQEQGHYPKNFTTLEVKRSNEDISATKVREAIKNDDIDTFRSMMPDGTDELFDDFKKELSQIKESYVGLVNFIKEALELDNINKTTYEVKDKKELKQIISKRIDNAQEGDTIDLNDLDVSKVYDMSYLFKDTGDGWSKFFNYDISEWDVSNVITMMSMFEDCKQFNCDLSGWDVSNVKDMKYMFHNCVVFNCDLSGWDVSNVKDMNCTFANCQEFSSDLSDWDIRKVNDFENMFLKCFLLKGNYAKWTIHSYCVTNQMFYKSGIPQNKRPQIIN